MTVVPATTRPVRTRQREALIMDNLGFVQSLARRYADRGEPLDDLVQSGMIGLVNAADRFDPSRGIDFRAFATPTILGEIRRHFRDHTWALRVSRTIKDDLALIARATERLRAVGGHGPTVKQIAAEAGLPLERVLDALAAQGAYRPESLTRPRAADGSNGERQVPAADAGYDAVDAKLTVGAGLGELPARERVILHLRFSEGLFQSEIAERVGLSQMHVSRLIARGLQRLREATEGAPRGPG